MLTVRTIAELSAQIQKYKFSGLTIGFVPTMGYLHAGHISLVQAAKKQCAVTIVSIFVNPKQFGPGEDFSRYPRDLEHDTALLTKAGADILFVPSAEEIYTPAVRELKADTQLANIACGLARPGHFDGVVTVVARLFDLVQPDKAFFGQKDYQQLKIIQKMTEAENYPVEIIGCPLVREPDGLAMSSRNKYLTPKQRQIAPVLYRALTAAAKALQSGKNLTDARQFALNILENTPEIKIDYLEFLDRKNLTGLTEYIPNGTVILVAVYLGSTRLIDNLEA